MKLKLNNGGIIKLQNAAAKIPNIKTTSEQWNNLGTGLNVQKLYIPASKSMTEPDDWRGKWETFLRKLRLRLESTDKIKAIGVFSSAYGKPTTIVKDGGSLA